VPSETISRVYKREHSPYWQAEWYDLNGRRRQRSTRCVDRRAAEARLREWERGAADPAREAARLATLRDTLQAFVDLRHAEAVAGRRSAETAKFYAKKAGLLSFVLGPDTRLADLSAEVIDRYISQRRFAKASDSTIHKELVTLRGALRLAKRHGKFPADIDAVLPSGFSPAYTPGTRWLSVAQVEALLAALPADRGAVVAFIVGSGAETRAWQRAQPGDYDPDAGTVRLRGTKRASRDRVVPVVFDWQRQLLALASAAARGERGLWHRRWGNVRRDILAACVAASIPPCSPTDLRRTFGHWMRGEGLQPATVGAALGHADARMAERVYARLDSTELARTMRREGGVAECHNSVRQSADSTALTAFGASQGEPVSPRKSVPRDGVEPPTRGFSIPVVMLRIPRKYSALMSAGAASVTTVSAGGLRRVR
jgi:integrase